VKWRRLGGGLSWWLAFLAGAVELLGDLTVLLFFWFAVEGSPGCGYTPVWQVPSSHEEIQAKPRRAALRVAGGPAVFEALTYPGKLLLCKTVGVWVRDRDRHGDARVIGQSKRSMLLDYPANGSCIFDRARPRQGYTCSYSTSYSAVISNHTSYTRTTRNVITAAPYANAIAL
jgi:hypothetical protein